MQKHGTILMLRNRDFIRTLVVITIFLNVFSQNTGVLADEWDEIYEKGKLALDQGEWNQAIVNFQQALHLRDKPDHQATTTSLKLIEYLPYYYLGQAYLYASDYQAALESFHNSMNAGAVKNTANQPRLEKLIEITQRLIQSSEQKVPAAIRETEFETKLSEIQNLIYNENYIQALKSFEDLKRLSPEDKRLTIIYNWIQNEQQKSVFEPNHAELGNQAEERFHEGLDYFLLGQYEQAMETFKAVEKIAPNFSVATSWIRKTQTEIERLKLDETKSQKEEALKPEVIEKIITQTTAPVFAIRSPTEALTEIRSKNLNLSGLAGDDQGIDYINLAVNGKPLLDTSGEKIMIQPQKNDDAKKFSFSTQIPLQMAENQIVLTAYDVDVPPHRTIEQFTVIRKRPIYQTTTFGISVGAIFLLGIGGLFISKMVKYRIAIVNKYNPYIAGSPIRTEEMFFGREKLLQRILNTLHNNSLMLYGPRRIGKTSLQHHLKHRLETLHDPEFYFIPVMIDLQGTSEDRFFSTLMEEILEVCKGKVNGKISFNLQEKKEEYSGRDFSKDLKILLQTLNKHTDKKLKLVLLMDEVDELNKYSEQVNQKLRSVFMKTFAENLVAVMSGAYIRKSWESEGSPWYNFFEEIEIKPLEKEEAIELIRKPVASIFSYEDAAIEKILAYSACEPYIIQKFCINVIQRIIEDRRRRVTVRDVEAVAAHVLDASDNAGRGLG